MGSVRTRDGLRERGENKDGVREPERPPDREAGPPRVNEGLQKRVRERFAWCLGSPAMEDEVKLGFEEAVTSRVFSRDCWRLTPLRVSEELESALCLEQPPSKER